jgi:hypothetical protein
MMKDEPRDLVKSMKGGVATLFVLAWNAPMVFLLFRQGDSGDVFSIIRIAAVQVGWLVLACLVVANSTALHRWVFRRDVPEGHFRRKLLVSAGVYAVLGVVIGAVLMLE